MTWPVVVNLLAIGLCSAIPFAILLFQRWEDRKVLQHVLDAHREVLAWMHRQQQASDDTESQIGRTWLPTEQDQHRVETLLQQHGKTRAHARTGSDPFSPSVKLAP